MGFAIAMGMEEIGSLDYRFTIFSAIFLMAGCVGLGVAALAWRLPSGPRNRWLFWLVAAVTCWCLVNVFETAASTVSHKIFWSQVSYIGICSTPFFFFLFAVAFSGLDRHLTARRVGALAVIPALTFLLSASNGWHGWLWPEVIIDEATNLGRYSKGIWYKVYVAYAYTLIVLGLATLYYAIFRFSNYYRGQFFLLLIGVTLPVIGNIMYLTDINPIPGFEWMPVGFIATSFILISFLRRRDVFHIMPVARKVVVDTMSDSLVVVSDAGLIVDVNPATAAMLGQPAGEMVSRPFDAVFQGWNVSFEGLCVAERLSVQQTGVADGQWRHYDLRVSRLPGPGGAVAGWLLLFRDITEHHAFDLEREALVMDLQKALEDVQTLSGLLPICAWCKNIRDDSGYWQSVEKYLRAHSSAQFSHSICPDCYQQMRDEEPLIGPAPPARPDQSSPPTEAI